MFNQEESQLILEALEQKFGGLGKAKLALEIVGKLQKNLQALQAGQETVQALQDAVQEPVVGDVETADPE